MGILHNTDSQAARRMLLQKSKVRRIINMSDLCFQLFDGAQRPTAFVLYGPQEQEQARSEEHTSELQSLMRISYAVFCLKKKKMNTIRYEDHHIHMYKETNIRLVNKRTPHNRTIE